MRPRLILPAALAALVALPAHAAAPIRLVEAYVAPEWNPRLVLQVSALTPAQRADVNYNVMASRLGDALGKARLNIHQDAVYPQAYVLLDYKAWSIPFFRRYEAPVNDPSYRALVVTAVDAKTWNQEHRIKLYWQVVVDQTGISNDPELTIPPLIDAAARYYGRNLTPIGLNQASSCAAVNGSQTGSHIAGDCNRALTPQALAGGGAGSGAPS